MKDKDFDDIFSRGLNEELNHKYDIEDWEKLSDRLNKNDDKGVGYSIASSPNNGSSSKGWLLSAIGLLLLLLLATNSWSLFKIYQAENDKKALFNEINALKEAINKHNSINELSNITTVHKDTIIVYKYIPYNQSKYRNNTSLFPKSFDYNKASIPIEDKKATNPVNNNIDTIFHITTPKSLSLVPLSDTILSYKSNNTNQPVAILPSINTKPYWYTHLTLLVLPSTLQTSKSIVKPSIEKKFLIGFGGGLINYHTSWLSRDSVRISRNEKSYQIGLKLEYALNDHWRIMLGGDYCPFSYKVYWQDSRYNLPALPNYFANNPTEYRFRSAATTQSLVQGYVGVKHVFSGHKWKPYLGLAYTRMEILPFEVDFSVLKLSTNKEIPVSVKQTQISVSNIALLNGGFEYKINSRLSGQIEGFYYRDMNKSPKTFNLFGLKGGLMIGF